MSKSRDDLLSDLDLLGFEREVPFKGLSGTRKWRWDAARFFGEDEQPRFGDRCGVAVEYHGKGAHTSYIAGTWRDMQKVTEGQLCGWIVVQCNVSTVNSGDCWTWIMKALGDEA